VLYDERTDVGAGQKLGEADMIGCPIRAVVSTKTGDQIEVKMRSEKDSKLVSLEELVAIIKISC
jgi:prolyl-tRNA synthetase